MEKQARMYGTDLPLGIAGSLDVTFYLTDDESGAEVALIEEVEGESRFIPAQLHALCDTYMQTWLMEPVSAAEMPAKVRAYRPAAWVEPEFWQETMETRLERAGMAVELGVAA